MRKLPFVVLLAISSVAQADTSDEEVANPTLQSYVGADVMLGLSGMGFAKPVIGVLMGAGSGGYRLHDLWWFHGQLSLGVGSDDEGGAIIGQGRAGLEVRPSCTVGGIACFVAGSDLGLQHINYTERGDPIHRATMTSLVAVPRVGGDFGGKRLRFRVAFELVIALLGRARWDNEMPDAPTGLIGGNLVIGAAWQW